MAAISTNSNPLPALSSVAIRVRRHRERRRREQRSIALDVRNTEIEWLVHHNYLASHMVNDVDAIAAALGAALDRLLR